jgi:hypothetical protein
VPRFSYTYLAPAATFFGFHQFFAEAIAKTFTVPDQLRSFPSDKSSKIVVEICSSVLRLNRAFCVKTARQERASLNAGGKRKPAFSYCDWVRRPVPKQ